MNFHEFCFNYHHSRAAIICLYGLTIPFQLVYQDTDHEAYSVLHIYFKLIRVGSYQQKYTYVAISSVVASSSRSDGGDLLHMHQCHDNNFGLLKIGDHTSGTCIVWLQSFQHPYLMTRRSYAGANILSVCIGRQFPFTTYNPQSPGVRSSAIHFHSYI